MVPDIGANVTFIINCLTLHVDLHVKTTVELELQYYKFHIIADSESAGYFIQT
jgi:hypothetical protein